MENKEEIYKHKFSFGISLEITIEDYKKIINKYKNYISSIYFSLPLGKEFHTREAVEKEYSRNDAREKLIDILDLFKENNIKLEAVINQYFISNKKILEAIKYLKEEINVDSICTLDEYAYLIKQHFPDMYLVSSFNNFNKTRKNIYNNSKIYNQIVIGRNFLRDIEIMKYIKSLGLDIKLLLNNGCSFNCRTCRAGEKTCKSIFENNLKKFSFEELYALQSFFPYELDILKQKINLLNIKEFKISNRPCTYKYLDDCLNSYIYNHNEEDYLKEDINNYRLWGRLTHFSKYFREMDINEIKRIKNEIWNLE